MALFGSSGEKARKGALLLASVLASYRPNLPRVVLDLDEDEDT